MESSCPWINKLSLKSISLASVGSRDCAVTLEGFPMSTPACTSQILTVPLGADAPVPKLLWNHTLRDPTVQGRQMGEGKGISQCPEILQGGRPWKTEEAEVSWGDNFPPGSSIPAPSASRAERSRESGVPVFAEP